LFVSLTLVGLGCSYPTTTDALSRAYPAWGRAFNLVDGLSLLFFLELFYLFPDGRFVPRWSRWAALVFAALFLLPALLEGLAVDLSRLGVVLIALNGALLISMGYAQVYRYRRASGRVERQPFEPCRQPCGLCDARRVQVHVRLPPGDTAADPVGLAVANEQQGRRISHRLVSPPVAHRTQVNADGAGPSPRP
jgi:hypothetical protein